MVPTDVVALLVVAQPTNVLSVFVIVPIPGITSGVEPKVNVSADLVGEPEAPFAL